jgi:hypothetical protein
MLDRYDPRHDTIATVAIRRNTTGDRAAVANGRAGEVTKLACTRGMSTCPAGPRASATTSSRSRSMLRHNLASVLGEHEAAHAVQLCVLSQLLVERH